MALRAILFDLDGVLVDSRASVERHWRRWAKERGLAWEPIAAVVHGQRSIDTIRDLAPALDAAREADELDRRQAQDTRGVVAVDGAAELLAGLGRGWAVVTSGRRGLARARLETAGLPPPPVLVAAEDVRRGKPAPDGFLAAAELLGAEPRACAVVEDAPTGIAAARAAGMLALAVATTHGSGELAGADHVSPSLRALCGRLAELLGGADGRPRLAPPPGG